MKQTPKVPKEITPDERLIYSLREMAEIQLHRDIFEPLLNRIGSHVQYVHGQGEEGKDFVFITRDAFGDPGLEVCQIKNQPFSGSSASENNLTIVITQILQCAKLLVTNPITLDNELPRQVTLFSTYDIPQRLTRSTDSLLNDFKTARCKFVGPDRIAGLIRNNLPHIYESLSCTSQGLGDALFSYVNLHHEAPALGLAEMKELSTFFIDVGMSISRLGLHSKPLSVDPFSDINIYDTFLEPDEHPEKKLDPDEILENIQNHIIAFQNTLPTVLHDPEPLRFSPPYTKFDGIKLYKITCDNIQLLNATVKNLLSSKQGSSATGLTVLLAWTEFVTFLVTHLSRRSKLIQKIKQTDSSFQIQDIPCDDILSLRESICIIGDAGAGKTSLARALTRTALNANMKCIYFPCLYYRRGSENLFSSICDFLSSISKTVSSDTATRILEEAEIIIIDGCDEAYNFGAGFEDDLRDFHRRLFKKRNISASLSDVEVNAIWKSIGIPIDMQGALNLMSERKGSNKKYILELQFPLRASDFARLEELYKPAHAQLSNKIARLHEMYRNTGCTIVLTSREVLGLNLSGTYHQLSLTPFTDAQLEAFVQKWFRNDEKKGSELITFLRHENHLREVCRRPLVASLIAAMHQNDYDLPHSKTEIYSQRFDLLLQDWDKIKNTLRRNLVKGGDKMELLTRLAFILHSQHRREFTREDVALLWRDVIRSLYPNVSVEDLLNELLVTNGVIEKFGESSYTLGHLSYQEYLTGRAVLQLQKERDLLAHYHQKWWREVFIFYAGLRGDVSDLLQRMQLLFGLDRNAGLLKDMISEARFTSPVVIDFVKHVIRDKQFILDSKGREIEDEE